MTHHYFCEISGISGRVNESDTKKTQGEKVKYFPSTGICDSFLLSLAH